MKKKLLVGLTVFLLPALALAVKFKVPPAQMKAVTAPRINPALLNHKVTIDPSVLKALQGMACPQGKTRYFGGTWDLTGYCGVANDSHCLPHYIYVDSPSGSVNEHSIGEMVWIVLDYPGGASIDGKEITGGYACVPAPFPYSLESDACPEGTIAHFESVFVYECSSSNEFTFQSCVSGYEKTLDRSQNLPQGVSEHLVMCELSGATKGWQYQDTKIPCGNSGAQMVGGDYACAYTK